MSTETPEPTPSDAAEKMTKAVEGLLAKHGDPTAALRVLMNENYAYRDQLRELKGKVPGDGAVILQGDDTKLWNTYRELGQPADLRKAITERDTHKADATSLRKEQVVRDAADLHFPGKAGVLKTLARDVEIVIGEGKDKDGKAVRVASVKGEGDALTPLDEYAEAHWGEFLPALTGSNVEPAKPRGSPPSGQGNPPVPRPGGGSDPYYEEALRIGQYQRM